MLSIGFDAKRLFNNATGLGNYSRTLVGNLVRFFPQSQYHLYTPGIGDKSLSTGFSDYANVRIHRSRVLIPGSIWRTLGLPYRWKKDGIQVFHGLSHEIPVGAHRSGIPTIVTIHDLIFKRHPHLFPLPDRFIYDQKCRYACNNAELIVAISEHTKRDIMEFYNISESKIRVVYQTCGTIFQRPADWSVPPLIDFEIKGQTLPDDYMLFVGSIIPRKNLEGCIRALEALPKSLRLPLVVVGRGKAHKAHLRRLLLEKGLEQEVLFCRDVGMEALRYLYQKARIFLYPSFYEGFGLPVLEALFAGVPVITSDVASLPEAGGGGALYVNPREPEALAEAISKILTNTQLSADLKEKGWQHARQFTAQKLTTQMMALYRELAPGSNP